MQTKREMVSRQLEPDYAVAPVTILIDSREQAPYAFRGFQADPSSRGGRRPLIVPTSVVGLPTGDYSIEGFHERIAIERKSLADLYGTVGAGRERFERELERLQQIAESHGGTGCAAVVIEATWPEIVSRTCWACDGTGCTRGAGATGGDNCDVCGGSGKLHPVERSKLSPKTVFRSINAWEIRYPRVHWHAMGTRSLAEHKVYRLLMRWWGEVIHSAT